MNAVQQFSETVDEIDDKFKKNIFDNKLNITTIENLAVNGLNNCRQIINGHIEELISNEIDEKDLISKKNKNGNK